MDTKEQVYDAEIAPLMAQIIATCKRRGIAMVATFHLPDDEQDTLYCTTCLPDGSGVFPDYIKEMEHVIYRKPEFFAFTITKS
jgi:hypothetical protein